MKRVVVAGASLGGLRTAEALRALGFDGEILLIGDEPYRPYNRPPLSKKGFDAPPDLADLTFRSRLAPAEATWRLGIAAVELDRHRRTVTLSDGTSLEFDGLVVATGIRPRRLGTLARAGSLVLRTVDDARRVARAIVPGAAVAIVGAGFLGCELAACVQAARASATVVGLEDLPMGNSLGPIMGTEVQRRHEDAGVRFALGTSVLGSDERGGKQCLTLTSGDEVTADVVIEAVGSLPNVEWLAGNGFDLSDGLLCDNSLAVPGAPWLVGVGDVARFPHPALDGACRRFEHWSMAGDMARHAAATLLHELHGQPPGERERLFAPLPWFWSDQYNWRIEAFGDPRGALDGARVIESAGDGLAIAYYDTSQRLVAVAGIGLAVRNWRARILQAYAAGSSASQPTRACRPPVRRI